MRVLRRCRAWRCQAASESISPSGSPHCVVGPRRQRTVVERKRFLWARQPWLVVAGMVEQIGFQPGCWSSLLQMRATCDWEILFTPNVRESQAGSNSSSVCVWIPRSTSARTCSRMALTSPSIYLWDKSRCADRRLGPSVPAGGPAMLVSPIRAAACSAVACPMAASCQQRSSHWALCPVRSSAWHPAAVAATSSGNPHQLTKPRATRGEWRRLVG